MVAHFPYALLWNICMEEKRNLSSSGEYIYEYMMMIGTIDNHNTSPNLSHCLDFRYIVNVDIIVHKDIIT